MKIVQVHTLVSCGSYPQSRHWREIRKQLHQAIQRCSWPPGSKLFTIFPQSGKKRGEGNGVRPIRNEFVQALRNRGWTIEGKAKNALNRQLGDFDAVVQGPEGAIVAEWETGNISSSHRSMNKLSMLLSCGLISAGTLIVPSRRLYRYLTDRVGNVDELEPYFELWKRNSCSSGVLEIVVIEQDKESFEVARIPKGTDGRSGG